MTKLLTVMIIALSVIVISSVLMQKSKSAGFSSAIGGGAEQLFGKKKSRGYEGILFKTTIVSSLLLVGVCTIRLILFT